jgi:hypothetical protein
LNNGVLRVSISKWTDNYERISMNVEAYRWQYSSKRSR